MIRPNKSALCTLNRVIQRLNADSSEINVSTTAGQTTQINTESANFKAEMVKCIYKASDLILAGTNNVFMPYQESWVLEEYEYAAFWKTDWQIRKKILHLPDGVLSISSFVINGTTLTEGTDFNLRPKSRYPKTEIAISFNASYTLPSAMNENITVTGIWGYHPDPDNMWQDSGDTGLTAGVNASVATIPVTSGNNFEILQYIRIDDEYMLITAISANNLTVQRGVRGTTAASHLIAATVDVFEPIEDVADECARLAIRRYQLRSGIEIVATGETAMELKLGDVDLSSAYKRYYIGSG